MSYARWSDGDVYIYLGTDGVYHCMCCPLMPTYRSHLFWAPSTEVELHECFSTRSGHEMLKHMKKHREAAHAIPDYAIDRLTEELKM